MKIALFLGKFNPFHKGHLEAVEAAFLKFHMDKIIVVPTMLQNPWWEGKFLDFDERFEIIKRSLLDLWTIGISWIRDNQNRIIISDIEKDLIPPYYEYATLHALKNKYCNDEVFVLCGVDVIQDIPNWMHGGKILEDYDFLVIDRYKDISSTIIQEKIKDDEDITPYVTPGAERLIRKFYEKEEAPL